MANHGLAKRYAELQEVHINMREQLHNEKMKLADQLIELKQTQLEGYKKYDDIVVQKDATIQQKNDLIEQHHVKLQKKNHLIALLMFLCLLAVGLLILFILFDNLNP